MVDSEGPSAPCSFIARAEHTVRVSAEVAPTVLAIR